MPPIALTPERIGAAWRTAKSTGWFDPAVFPNIGGAQDASGLAGVMAALAPLDETTVVKQLLSGARLAVQRGVTGSTTTASWTSRRTATPGSSSSRTTG